MVKMRDLNELKFLLVKRIRSLKLKISDLKLKLDNLGELVEKEVTSIIKDKIKRMVMKSVFDEVNDMEERVLRKLFNGYLNLINNNMRHICRDKLEKNIHWQTKIFTMNEMSVKLINQMYKKGWKICHSGPLAKQDRPIVIFEKPKLIKEE